MAQRRMFSQQIIDSDAFLDMPLSAQALYFHLSMRADDDGFINNPSKIMRVIGGNKNDLDLLLAKNFIIGFETGVVVIKHWLIHNYIRKDRYTPTPYQEEKARLSVKTNDSYTLGQPNDNQMTTNGQPRLGKDRLGKVSLGKEEIITHTPDDQINSNESEKPKEGKHKYGEFKNVLLTEEEYEKIMEAAGEKYIEALSMYLGSTGKRYKSHYMTILNWMRRDKETGNISGRRDVQEPEWLAEYLEELTKMEG